MIVRAGVAEAGPVLVMETSACCATVVVAVEVLFVGVRIVDGRGDVARVDDRAPCRSAAPCRSR